MPSLLVLATLLAATSLHHVVSLASLNVEIESNSADDAFHRKTNDLVSRKQNVSTFKDMFKEARFHRSKKIKSDVYEAGIQARMFEESRLHRSKRIKSDAYEPTIQAHHNLFIHRTNLTPLEIGIYSLLIIFAIAVLVFVVSCSVFAVKFRQKLPPETVETTRVNVPNGGGGSAGTNKPVVAKDWVWLGMATLERNDLRASRCPPTLLLPQKDFNGNHQMDVITNPLAHQPLILTNGTTPSNLNIETKILLFFFSPERNLPLYFIIELTC